jgi:hypothetical protein
MINKINSILFLSALVGMLSFFLFLPKQKLSEGEKRKLAVFPSFTFDTYLNGTWADSLDEFVDDHFPFRNKFISMAETFNSNKGIHLTHQEKIFIGKKRIGNTTNEEDTTHAKMISMKHIQVVC